MLLIESFSIARAKYDILTQYVGKKAERRRRTCVKKTELGHHVRLSKRAHGVNCASELISVTRQMLAGRIKLNFYCTEQ